MKKVGIITFHASHNCGSFLQSYALQKFLLNNKFEAEIINFSNKGQRELYKVTFKNNSIKNIVRNIVLFPRRKMLNNTYSNYELFIHKNLHLSSKEFYTLEELKNYSFDYDIFICGSDQIWNVTIADFDPAYFLSFTDKTKIAYAPSFGARKMTNYLTSLEIERYVDYLKCFSLLTIREKNGQKWLKEILDIDVPVVLDPTLLLERHEYECIEDSYDKKIQDPYIFYYSPSYNPKINNLVKSISKKYGLKVVAWNPRSYYLKFMNFSNFYLPKKQNPGVYLSLIRDANMVITTSFHGTIFSTIYNKNFWVIKNGEMYGDDDRVKTLIEQLSIEERLISMEFDDSFDYLSSFDYDMYNKNLAQLKNNSSKILLEALCYDKT